MEFTSIEIFLIIFSQIVLLFIYKKFNEGHKKKYDPLEDKLKLIDSILAHTNHNKKIVTLEEIKKIELEANRINVFSQDIYRDVKDNGQFSTDKYNIGTFYDTVQKNIEGNSEYRYFLKKDANFRHSLINFFTSHKDVSNVDFVVIPSEKYYFYDEVYLYEFNDDSKQSIAYEFLPSISNESEERLYYLELDSKQVERLEKIKDNLYNKYYKESLVEVELIKSKIGNFSKI